SHGVVDAADPGERDPVAAASQSRPHCAAVPARSAAFAAAPGMSGFRPRLYPALFTIAVVLVCSGLGLWQLQRLEWKRALIAQREAAVAAAPVAPPRTLADARALEFHRVVAEGAFRHDKEILLNAIGPKG